MLDLIEDPWITFLKRFSFTIITLQGAFTNIYVYSFENYFSKLCVTPLSVVPDEVLTRLKERLNKKMILIYC